MICMTTEHWIFGPLRAAGVWWNTFRDTRLRVPAERVVSVLDRFERLLRSGF